MAALLACTKRLHAIDKLGKLLVFILNNDKAYTFYCTEDSHYLISVVNPYSAAKAEHLLPYGFSIIGPADGISQTYVAYKMPDMIIANEANVIEFLDTTLQEIDNVKIAMGLYVPEPI